MNSKAVTLIKNFSYTLTSNLVSLFISSLVVLVVPKLIGVEEYGYWQLYMFYISYTGFALFGWNDGIYLRYGGKDYGDLDKGLLFSQFWMFFIFQSAMAILVFILATLLVNDETRRFILYMVALFMVLMNLRLLLLHILQATNRIKEYATITLLDRILYFSIITLLLLFGTRQFGLLIGADLIGKFISLIYAMYYCKDIVFCKIRFRPNFNEAAYNINVGIKLMVSNIASILIIGIVRFGIERGWNVATFGKVSLTLSVSNLMMLFINAVGVIMYPVLRRTDDEKLSTIYTAMRTCLMTMLLGVLVLYYPLNTVLSAWLPQYSESLLYMVLVFPMFLYEGKMALLISTYFKALRKEKHILYINTISMLLSLIMTIIFTILHKNLTLSISSIVILLAFRCVLAEIVLSRMLSILVYKDIFLELSMTLIFIITGWTIGSWQAIIVYMTAYMIYLLIKRKEIISTTKVIRGLLGSPAGQPSIIQGP